MSVITKDGGSATDQRSRLARAEPTSSRPDPDARPEGALSASLRKRLDLLPVRDRAIVELTMRSNLSRSGIARALGLAPGQVSRRLRVLYARLHDPLVVALFDARCPLSPAYRQLGTEHFLLGLSPRELADKHQVSIPEVRRMLVYLRGWQKGATGR
ncbi:MAG: hypothetical protein M3478_10190 [Planctomycetota bacterium]|nr:hypothetical protein [Planctomycetota bacterium]